MKYCPRCAAAIVNQVIDGYERQVCSDVTCGFIHWDNPVAVVLALVQFENKFILARNSDWPKTIFSLISGYVERDESLEQSAMREVKEELGLQPRVKCYIGSYPYARTNQIIAAYWLTTTGRIELNDEIAEIKLLTAQELLNYDFGKLVVTRQLLHDWAKLFNDRGSG